MTRTASNILWPLAACLVGLTSCAPGSNVVVDRTQVSDAKYDRDMAECKKSSELSLSTTNPVASCMTGKGYNVLMGRSRLP